MHGRVPTWLSSATNFSGVAGCEPTSKISLGTDPSTFRGLRPSPPWGLPAPDITHLTGPRGHSAAAQTSARGIRAAHT